jgi:hypothetical protein
MERKIIGIEDKVPVSMLIPLSIQHLFAMFGASVLVPILFGINSGIVLFMNGVGTLLFILITKGRAPAYLGSSFAFLAPASLVIAELGFQYALGGFVVVGALGCVLALIIYKFGTDWIDVVLPPAAMGPVVALIGLELASNTIKGGSIGAEIMTDKVSAEHVIVFLITLGVAVFGSVLFRKFLSVIRFSLPWSAAMWRPAASAWWILPPLHRRRFLPCPTSSSPNLTLVPSSPSCRCCWLSHRSTSAISWLPPRLWDATSSRIPACTARFLPITSPPCSPA